MILSSHIVSLDLEHGTYRLAWTQTITSGRWVPVKPGPPVVAALLASGALIPPRRSLAHRRIRRLPTR